VVKNIADLHRGTIGCSYETRKNVHDFKTSVSFMWT